ncbi:MAG: peptidoglycan-binding protein [Cyanothece sp. SIO1E1]|nr:peptidoglycan-binding protein [Cyanothece sp. SIO1E1]
MFYRFSILLLTCTNYLAFNLAPVSVFSAAPAPMDASLLLASNSLNPEEPPTTVSNLLLLAQASSVAPPGKTVFKPGSQGEEVVELQKMLKRLGYYTAQIDGRYGKITRDAVIAFQKQSGLTANGLVDLATWDSLQSSDAATAGTSATSESILTPSDTIADSPASAERENAAETRSAIDAESNEAANQATNTSRFIWWALSLLAVLATAGGLFYTLRRLEQEKENSDSDKVTPVPHNPRTSGKLALDTTQVIGNTLRVGTTKSNGYSEPVVASSSTSTQLGQRRSLPGTLSNSTAKQLAVEETTRLARVNIIEELLTDLQGPDPTKRRKAIWELGQRGENRAVKPLVDLLIDSDSKQRSLILAALSEIGVRTLKPMNRALAISLQDPSPEVRKNAIRDLTRIYDLVGQISQLLGHAVEDPDLEVRETAHWALGQLNRIRAVALPEGGPEEFLRLQNSAASSEKMPKD